MTKLVNYAAIFASKFKGFELRSFNALGTKVYFLESQHKTKAKPTKTISVFPGFGDSAYLWAPFLIKLRNTYGNKVRILVLDFPGYSGLSEHPKGKVLTFDEQEDVAHIFLKQIAKHTDVLLSNSMGGWLSTRVVAKDPSLIDELVHLNPAGAFTSEDDVLRVRDLFQINSPMDFARLLTHIFYRGGRAILPFAMLSGFYQNAKKESSRQILDSIQREHFINEILPTIKNRIHIVWGLEDKLFPEHIGRVWEHLGKSVSFYPVPKSGHMPQLEASSTVMRVIDVALKLST